MLLRLDLQFYAFFTIVLSGAVFGFLFDVLRVAREYYRPSLWVGSASDLLFWFVATAALAGGLFYANWAELRFYVIVGALLGVGLYMGLAGPLVRQAMRVALRILEWFTGLLVSLIQRLIWRPIVGLGFLLWRMLRFLASTLLVLVTGLGKLVRHTVWILARPFRRCYRGLRLRYLLALRRWRRNFWR